MLSTGLHFASESTGCDKCVFPRRKVAVKLDSSIGHFEDMIVKICNGALL